MVEKLGRACIAGALWCVVFASGATGCLDGGRTIGEVDDALLVGPPEPEPTTACERFCDEAGEIGCPQRGDCLEMCREQHERSDGCEPELDALLACAPPHLAPPSKRGRYFQYPTCGLTPFATRDDYETNEPEFSDCDDQAAAYDACIDGRDPALQQFEGICHVTSPFLTRVVGAPRTSEYDVPNAVESSYLRCPVGSPAHEALLKSRCDGEGLCTCYVDHEPIATCDLLLQGMGMVVVPASCCAPAFEDYLAFEGYRDQ